MSISTIVPAVFPTVVPVAGGTLAVMDTTILSLAWVLLAVWLMLVTLYDRDPARRRRAGRLLPVLLGAAAPQPGQTPFSRYPTSR